ncbi:reverse transcriptase domain-containing protein [Tanacetum coccineum]
MPLSMWKKLSLPELTPTRMTLALAIRTVAYPAGIAEDVFVQVGKFTFPDDFVVVDYDVDPRVPLILGRSFLRTTYALVDVHGKELTLRVGDEKLVFNVESTSKYPLKHGDESIHKIDILDITASIISMSDFILEEIDTFLSSDDSTSLDVDDGIFNSEGDISLIEELLNNEILNNLPHPLHDLPPHLEYAFLEGTSKLPVTIAKDLKREEKEQLLKVLKSHKRAIAWKISDIRGIDPNFCTHKILMEDDFKPVVQHQRREKTIFSYPYRTFAYRRLPFDLCNAPGTFRRCMVAIFHDMIKKTTEVFMDDFSVFGNSFSSCLSHLDMMLKWCEDINLVLNWEKCHFMVKEGIVLGHKISKNGIEVDRDKLDVIAKLPPLTTCQSFFEFLKKKLTEAPILVSPDWDLSFELMCDASDFAVGAVLGQRKDKYFKPIHYASKTLSDAQTHYTTTEKELLAMVYAFEKFQSYLVLSKTIVYTDHSALKYLFAKQDAKPRLLRWILLLQEFNIKIHNKKKQRISWPII